MKRLSPVLIPIALLCGCAGEQMSSLDVSAADACLAPGISPITSQLLSVSEDEWHVEVDAGDLEFDEAGVPLMSLHDRRMRDFKARRFGVRMGPITKVELDAYPSTVDRVYEEGPVGGFFVSLGPRTWWFALELGVDIMSLKGEYYNPNTGGFGNDTPGSFNSFVVMTRFDAVVYWANPLKIPRLYIANGFRQADENTEIRFDDRRRRTPIRLRASGSPWA